jgi:hypothetical protein
MRNLMSDPHQILINALQSLLPQADAASLSQAADQLLRGQPATLGTSTASLSFGQDNNLSGATISIGSIAGGNITNVTINYPPRNSIEDRSPPMTGEAHPTQSLSKSIRPWIFVTLMAGYGSLLAATSAWQSMSLSDARTRLSGTIGAALGAMIIGAILGVLWIRIIQNLDLWRKFTIRDRILFLALVYFIATSLWWTRDIGIRLIGYFTTSPKISTTSLNASVNTAITNGLATYQTRIHTPFDGAIYYGRLLDDGRWEGRNANNLSQDTLAKPKVGDRVSIINPVTIRENYIVYKNGSWVNGSDIGALEPNAIINVVEVSILQGNHIWIKFRYE